MYSGKVQLRSGCHRRVAVQFVFGRKIWQRRATGDGKRMHAVCGRQVLGVRSQHELHRLRVRPSFEKRAIALHRVPTWDKNDEQNMPNVRRRKILEWFDNHVYAM